MRKRERKADEKKQYSKHAETGTGRRKPPDGLNRDYSVYIFSGRELVQNTGIYLVLDGCISYLFFGSWKAVVLLLPGMIPFLQERKKELLRRRQREMKMHFLDGIQLMAASLQAGYSAENALREAVKELAKVHGADSHVVREFRHMDAQMAMNRNLEDLLLGFGRRSGIDDIRSFAEVFLTARRTGGDLLNIIRNTVSCIRQKQETLQEIETTLAGKRMEQNIMSLIPILILAYVKLTSPEFVSPMYGNPAGTVIMSICFLVYAAAYFWGRKIVQIEV